MKNIEVLNKSPFLKRVIDYPRPSLIKCSEAKSSKNKAIIICVGGGYCVYGEGEGFPLARVFDANGYVTFILCYSLGEGNPFPTQMRELALAVNHVRKNCDEYGIDPEDVVVCGLSAGGHLAASLGIHADADWLSAYDFPEDARPDRLILGYPVTGEVRNGFARTFETLSANIDNPDLIPLMYLDKQVNSHMPPTFIWHNEDDEVIPSECTHEFEQILKEKKVPHEVHYFSDGGHAVKNKEPGIELALKWLKK